jgi:hypothetical protein
VGVDPFGQERRQAVFDQVGHPVRCA